MQLVGRYLSQHFNPVIKRLVKVIEYIRIFCVATNPDVAYSISTTLQFCHGMIAVFVVYLA
jgi:ribonucleotide monophosphatase NagD (HAD superfamily)